MTSTATAKAAKITADAKPAAKPSMVNYNKAVRTARAASQRVGLASWVIGDAALSVATEYGENTLARFADEIGVELATVRNYRTMAAKYPVDKISRELQNVTVYGILASQDDAHELVTVGNDGLLWTVSAARALIKARKDALVPLPAHIACRRNPLPWPSVSRRRTCATRA